MVKKRFCRKFIIILERMEIGWNPFLDDFFFLNKMFTSANQIFLTIFFPKGK